VVNISLKLIGKDEYILKLKKYKGEIKNLRSVFNAISDDIYKLEESVFEAQGKPNWKKLSPRYKSWKDKHYPGQKILSLTGTLRGAATGMPGGDLIRPVRIQTNKSLKIGLQGVLTVHQWGNKNLPARKIYNFTRNDFARWADIYRYYQKSAIERIF